jgi:hypothetical protein
MLLSIIIMEHQDHEGWTVVGKKTKRNKIQKNILIDNDDESDEKVNQTSSTPPSPPQMLQDQQSASDNGDNFILPFSYNLWCHDIYNKDWSINGYTRLCNIETVARFWKVFNNLDKLGHKVNNFFLMKDGIDPIWEHETNRNGGICSFKVETDQSLNVYEDLCAHMVCNLLINNFEDINGISYSPKNSWVIIKIWNKDKNNDLSKVLNHDLLNKYQNCCIRYKANEPEW